MGKKTGKRRTPQEEAARLQKLQEQRAAQALERRRQDLSAVNIPAEAATLPSAASIQVTRAAQKRDGQTVDDNSARRLDAFAALRRALDPGCFDAGRKYEQHLLIRRGENDKGSPTERVDRTAGFTTDAKIDAALWLEGVDKKLSRRDRKLVFEFIEPTKPWQTWREPVQHVTGETGEKEQSAAVRATMVNLRDAIEEHEREAAERRRKAA